MADETVVVPPDVNLSDLAHAAALRIIESEEPTPPKEPGAEAAPVVDEPQPPVVEGEPSAAPKAEEPPAPVVPKFKVKFRGDDDTEQELEVDEHELKSGYVRKLAYQKKSDELARERQGLRDEVKKQVEPTVKEFQEKLALYEQALWKTLAPEIQNTDWNKLAQEQPAEWAQRMQAVNNVQGVLQAIKGEQEKLSLKAQQEQKESMQAAARGAVKALRERIPNWNNDLYGKILKAGQDHYQFKPEEVNAITDPRAIEVLNDARLYRELQQTKPQVTKKVAEVPKVVRPGAVERSDKTDREQWKQGLANLKQRGGKERDAVQIAAMLLEREGIK